MVEFQRIFRVSSRVLSILSLCIGCVSGTVRKVQVGQELPEDLSKELQTRFAIRETESLPQVYLSQVQQLTEPNKKKKGKKLSLKKNYQIILSLPIKSHFGVLWKILFGLVSSLCIVFRTLGFRLGTLL